MDIERKTLNIQEDKERLKYLEKLNFLTIPSYIVSIQSGI